ncbi:hypothetical protein JDV02_006604 [Purpureocillium takamizusanense]|uniref:Uncharacterized protein n=1 Tax=Purpureocillium takamizusanense TaxID=2060973 RepID=A0A9Q8VCX1_9HYPO|nr:uncharacterized protein JDV02_006604 [Purpureocillium takamizusanense]UNI20526.1 hypothetical protein JDV02_006604 [Purpureocillium takamizusanense]
MRLALTLSAAATVAITTSVPAVLAGGGGGDGGGSGGHHHVSLRTRVVPSDTLLRADDVLSLPYESHQPSAPLLLLRRTPLVSQEPSSSSSSSSSLSAAAAQAGNNNNTSGGVTTSAGGAVTAFNASNWDAVTDAACIDALAVLPRSSNPSGNCLCYNLPSLDTASGVFEADLRLYRISTPRDAFAGVSPVDISVGVAYRGASVSPVAADDLMGLGAVANRTRLVVAPRAAASAAAAADGGPKLLRKYLFVGQIDKARMQQSMSMAALESLVIPTFTLSATDRSGTPISTNVSLNEASFLTGVFASQVVLSDFSAAQAAVDARLAALRNGTAAFVLPGTQLMVFPIGLVITAVWLLLGVSAYAVGTWQRVNYAETYRRRVRVSGKPVAATF